MCAEDLVGVLRYVAMPVAGGMGGWGRGEGAWWDARMACAVCAWEAAGHP